MQEDEIQTPSKTPRKRMSRAEKARIESEELLKSFGVTMEAGRQTRSSRRGPVVESPKPEPMKRKPTNTPRRSKKAKISETDSTDGANHVEESNQNEAQVQLTHISCSFMGNNIVSMAFSDCSSTNRKFE